MSAAALFMHPHFEALAMAAPGYVMQYLPRAVQSMMEAGDPKSRRASARASLAVIKVNTERYPEENPYRRAILELHRLLKLDDEESFSKAGRLAFELSMISHAQTLHGMDDEEATQAIESALKGPYC